MAEITECCPAASSRRTVWATWLLVVAVALAGAEQWLLGRGHTGRGGLLYLLGAGLLLGALLVARDRGCAPERAGGWSLRRFLWLPLAIVGQLGAFLLARPAHTFWPVFLPWGLSLIAAIASVSRAPAIVIHWRPSARLVRGFAIGGIVVLAAALRFTNLAGVPGEIHGDEGEFGSITLDVLRGQGPSPFGVAFLDDPALYPYLLAPFVAFFGVSMTAIRLLSAIVGTATVLVMYCFVRDVGGHRAGLIAALLLAGSPPHIHFSRLALNIIEAPFFACLALWFVAKALATQRPLWYLAAGVAGGLGCYFHFSARIVAPTLVAILLWQLLAGRVPAGGALRGFALTAAGGLLSVSPFLGHTLAAPWQLTDHMNSRLIWRAWGETAGRYQLTPDNTWGILRSQVGATLAAFLQRPDNEFFARGDMPLVGVLVAPLVALGLCALCARPRSLQAGVLLPAFVVPCICGGVLVVNAGVFHRLLTALPPALAAGALLIDRLLARLVRPQSGRAGPVVAGLLLLLAPLAVLQDVSHYFGPVATAYASSVATAQAQQLQALPPGTVAYVLGAPYIYADHGPSRYLGHAVERHNLFNPTVALPARSDNHPLAILVNPAYADWLPLLRNYYPQAGVGLVRQADGQPLLFVVMVPADTPAATVGAGLAGTVRPSGSALALDRSDPTLAFLNLDEIAGGTDYAARWAGWLQPPAPGNYQLEIVTNGAVTLALDGAPLVAAAGVASAPHTLAWQVTLDQRPHAFLLQGIWTGGNGELVLYWRKENGERELVPPTAFLPHP